MKKFATNIGLFLIILLLIFSFLWIGTTNLLKNGKYYLVNENAENLILGHSHAENAFNDSLIYGFRNFGNSAESYFYTYYKIKKIVENNKQIKTVFIIYTNNQIELNANNRIWSDVDIYHSLPKYSTAIDCEGYKLLLSKNPKSLLSSGCKALKENLYFILKLNSNSNYINAMEWGRYNANHKVYLDNIVNSKKKKNTHDNRELSVQSIDYLLKIISLLNSKKINTFLLRSPLQKEYHIDNEVEFRQVLSDNKLNNIFLDFKDYPLNCNQFADLEHLNTSGANEFSRFFNMLIEDSLLLKENKQAFINEKIIESILKKNDPIK